MRKDLIIGIVLSLALHSGLLLGDKLFPKKAVEAPPPKEEEKVIQMTPPPPEPEEPEEVEELVEEVTSQLAPPSLVDLPTVVPVNAFTQPLQPPPPPGIDAKGSISIPVVKPGTKFGAGMKDLFNVADLDQAPSLRAPLQVNYPFEMRRAGISGEVLVEFIVSTNGDVVAAQVVRSSQREFELPAIQAIQKAKFKPGRKGGRTVNVRVQQPISFNLNDS